MTKWPLVIRTPVESQIHPHRPSQTSAVELEKNGSNQQGNMRRHQLTIRAYLVPKKALEL